MLDHLSLDVLVALGEARRLAATAPPGSAEQRLAAAAERELAALRAKLTCRELPDRPPVTAEVASA